jgi:hypothetical protein
LYIFIEHITLNTPALSGVNSTVLSVLVNVFLILNAGITKDLEHPGICTISASILTGTPIFT